MCATSLDRSGTPQLAIKIDVDTHRGMREGVPRLLRILREFRIPATFFISCGPDHSGRAVRRIVRKGFLAKMLRTGAGSTYGWRTLLYGTLLPGPQIARSFPSLMRELAGEHEVGLHGYDHVYWQDRLCGLDEAEVDRELRRGVGVFNEILGRDPVAFAAPGWQCTHASLAAIERVGFRYHSDTRGVCPYLPTAEGVFYATPEIPTTWPTLDEVYGRRGRDHESLVGFYRSQVKTGLNVHTIHAELEGMGHAPFFTALLAALESEVTFVRLGQVAASLESARLPRCRIEAQPIEGRSGTVATQGDRLPC